MALKVAHWFIEKAAEPISNVVERVAQRSPAFQDMCRRLARSYNVQSAQSAHRRQSIFEDVMSESPTITPLTDKQASKVRAGPRVSRTPRTRVGNG
mmetsp:Transcript_16233/g.42018  ORF Transcript_16233/g.42018 Transcript_16233/m.42018 type:complete len:96 (-) Transcript_16233:414-701(-)